MIFQVIFCVNRNFYSLDNNNYICINGIVHSSYFYISHDEKIAGTYALISMLHFAEYIPTHAASSN